MGQKGMSGKSSGRIQNIQQMRVKEGHTIKDSACPGPHARKFAADEQAPSLARLKHPNSGCYERIRLPTDAGTLFT